jgi:acetyltransferase-like isoleucine patch superfamily enzyme
MAPRPKSQLAAALAGLLAFAPAGEALAGPSAFGTLAAGPACAAAFPGNGGGKHHSGRGSTININKNVTIFKPITINNKINVYKPITINKSVIVNKPVTLNNAIDASRNVTINKPVTINNTIDNSKTISI